MDENIDQEMADLFTEPAETDPVTPDAVPTSEPQSQAQDSTAPADNSANTEDNTANSASEDAATNNNSETDIKTDTVNPTDTVKDTKDAQAKSTPFSAEDKFTSKQNKAFAELRTQNKEYEQLLLHMAQVAKLDVKNAKEAKEVLAARIQQTEAKQKQIDPQVLAELENNRKQIAEMQRAQIKERALSGFAKLKTLHGLSDTDLNTFADALIAKNKNPFEQEMDLVAEYRLAYFDQLMEKAREEGKQAEIARSKKAQQSGSNPGTQRSTPTNTGGSEKSLKTPDDLDALFKELGL